MTNCIKNDQIKKQSVHFFISSKRTYKVLRISDQVRLQREVEDTTALCGNYKLKTVVMPSKMIESKIQSQMHISSSYNSKKILKHCKVSGSDEASKRICGQKFLYGSSK